MPHEHLYVGFNRRVVALDKKDGSVIWDWKAGKGTGYPALLVDGDCLFASVAGYTYCLDRRNGREVWFNELKGYGAGIPTLATADARSSMDSAAAAAEAEQQQRNAAAAGA